MAYKQPSTGPFKMMGSSPAKKSPAKPKTGKGTVSLRDARGGRGSLDFWNQTPDETKVAKRRGAREHYVANDNFSKNKKPANFNMEGGKTTTPGHGTTKMAKAAKKVGKVAKKIAGKAAKFAGGKALGVAGMLMATSSKADQPKKGKGKKEYEGGKIDFTKKK